MSDVDSHLHQVNVESGVISGLAALVFDILLLRVITCQVQFLCRSANLYLIYDRRKSLFPTASRLGFLTGSPVGHINLARCFSILIAACTAAVIVLGFAVDGKTVKTFETVKYSSAILATTVPLEIDIAREFARIPVPGNRSRKAVSRRIVAAFELYTCAVQNFTHSTQYAYAYRDLRINHSLIALGTRLPQGECITKPSFENELLLRRARVRDITRSLRCDLGRLELSMQDGDMTGHANVLGPSGCPVRISRMQCFREQGTSCAGVGTVKSGTGNKTYLVLVPDANKPNLASSAEILNVERAYYERLTAGAAFLAQVFEEVEVYYLGQVLFSSVVHDIALNRAIGTREVSEIDIRFAAPAVGFILCTTVILGIAGVISWSCIVYMKGRRRYNTFSTVPEILELAGNSGTRKILCRNGDLRCIGTQSDRPILGVMSAAECNTTKWAEDEIQ